jgi:predicted O-methyltransferase YrrM
MAEVVTLPDDRLQLLMLLSDNMLARDDRVTALHFLQSARWFVDDAQAETRAELMKKLVALGAPHSAMDIAMADVLDGETQPGQAAVAQLLRKTYEGMRHAATSRTEHGHELLLAYLEARRTRLQQLAAPRQLTLIEIGTTREDVPGQGSTLKLAQYCLQHQLHFVTVDMDPHNTRMALATFQRLGATAFEAVTMKGEDYLRQREGDIDLVFLDAYDFDHGKHSELRQSRYEKYLGARIDEQACHRMHLDCAQTLVSKLWAHGVVCVDDTWQEDGSWTAKGTLAMPHLLAQGFRVVDARNRAALLVRQASAAS